MDPSPNLALQQLGEAAGAMLSGLSVLGSETFFEVLIPIVYWCISPSIGIRLALVFAGSAYANAMLKWAFHQPRPFWIDDRVRAIGREPTFGMPSGHAQVAAAAWGYLAVMLSRRVPRAAAAAVTVATMAIAAAVAASRIYLGVHFAADVVGGVFAGLLFLAGWLALERPAAEWLSRQGTGAQIGVAIVTSLTMLGVGLVVREAFAPLPIRADWAAQALRVSGETIDPRTLATATAGAAVVAGGGAGYALMMRTARFATHGTARQYALRLLIGFTGLLALRAGLSAIFPREPEAAEAIFRYLRYAALMLWATWAAPWLFIRLGLAHSAQSPA